MKPSTLSALRSGDPSPGPLRSGPLSAGVLTAACVLCVATAPTTAHADVLWWLTGAAFDDGTLLSGEFTTNVYGYVSSWNLTTETNGVFTGYDYTNGGIDYSASGSHFIDFQPGYFSDLHIVFQDDLTIPSPEINPIVTGGASYECQGSYSCFVPAGATRYLVSGEAVVPEPAAWGLMLVGFAGVGCALRRVARPVTA